MDLPELFIEYKVPIFYETSLPLKDGSEFKFTPDRLRQLVEVNNARIAEGENPTIIMGHNTPGDCACSLEPPAVGVILQFYFDELTSFVLADFGFYASAYRGGELTKEYPYRSVEIFAGKMILSAVALLNSRPRLELGMLFSESNAEAIHFAIDDEKLKLATINKNTQGVFMLSEDQKQEILELFAQTDVCKYVMAQMTAETKDEPAAEPEAVAEDKENEDKPAEDQGEPAEDPKPEEANDEDKEKEEADKYSLVYAELSETKSALQALKREKELVALQHQGFDLDLNEELTDSLEMTDAQFDKHLQRLKRVSRKSPVGQRFDFKRLQTQANGLPNKDELDEIARLAQQKQIPFHLAMSEFKSSN